MKFIKKYEFKKFERKLSSVCFYFEDIIPVSNEEGFLECLFIEPPETENEVLFEFTFDSYTEEEVFERFYKFLEDNNLKIYEEHIGKINNYYFIIIILSMDRINEIAKEYNNIRKYNL